MDEYNQARAMTAAGMKQRRDLDLQKRIAELEAERDAIQRDYESLVTVFGSADEEVGRLRALLKQLVEAVDEMDGWRGDEPRIDQIGFAMHEARRYLMEPLKNAD